MKGGHRMYVKEIKNKSNKPMYLLYDKSGKIVTRVYKFILHLARIGNSKHTLRSYAFRLKLLYEWLEVMNLDCLDIVQGRDATHKAPLEYLSDFIMWLKYPTYNPKVVNFDRIPLEAVRTNNTINDIMSSVYAFYDYLAYVESIPQIEAYKELRINDHSSSFLSEMVVNKEKSEAARLKQKPEKRNIDYITRDEFWKIYNACTCRRDKIICGLMFDAALRVSEVVGLHIADLKHLNEGRIDVVFREDPNNPDAAVKYRSEGYVFIPPYLVSEIVAYLNEISDIDTNYFLFNLWGDTKYHPMRTDTIRKKLKKIGKKVGIPDLHPHQFRHGCAVELCNIVITSATDPNSPFYGMQMVDIQDKLRHKNAQSTEIYAKSEFLYKWEAAEKHYKQIGIDYGDEESFLNAVADSILINRRNKK